MSRSSLLRSAAILCCIASAASAQTPAKSSRVNPLTVPSTLPFQAPRFDQIKDTDYQPAFEQGMEEQIAEIDGDREQPRGADLRQHDRGDGALGPDARPGEPGLLRRVAGQHQRRARQGADRRGAQARGAQRRDLSQSQTLRARQGAVRQARHAQARCRAAAGAELYYSQFVHAGAQLSDADKAKLRALNKQISTCDDRLPAEAARGHQGRRAGGRRQGQARRARAMPRSPPRPKAPRSAGWPANMSCRCRTRRSSRRSPSLADRATRAEAVRARAGRAPRRATPTTRARLIPQLAQLRAEKAKLLGYPNYAAYVAVRPDGEDAGGGAGLHRRSSCPRPPPKQRARRPRSRRRSTRPAQHFELKPWDWERYSEQGAQGEVRPG